MLFENLCWKEAFIFGFYLYLFSLQIFHAAVQND